jgi:hypothetical protein
MPNSAYYKSLITSEYQASPNMLAWLGASIQPFQDTLACLAGFPAAFDIITAVGPQLDILGSILGQPRTVTFQPSGAVSPVLDDTTYRLLLQASIQKNHWDGTLDALIGIWRFVFPGGLLIVDDHQNMTVDLFVAAAFTSIIQDLVLHGYMLPRPQGVLYTYFIATLPIFGFDRDDAFVAGFDQGHFV